MYEVKKKTWTWDELSAAVYATGIHASILSSANPDVSLPVEAGTTIVVPQVATPPLVAKLPPLSRDETGLVIDGKRFRFWESVRITRAFDTVDSIEFTAPFEPELRDVLRPMSYKPVAFFVGGDVIFTGTMIDVTPTIEDSRRVVNVTGYSVPGVLEDCMPHPGTPLDFLDTTLYDVIEAVASPFGVQVEAPERSDSFGEPIQFITRQETTRALTFLTQIAKPLGYVLSSTPRGELLIRTAPSKGSPSDTLRQGEPPLLRCVPTFDPKRYYSHLTAVEPVIVSGLGSPPTTFRNPSLQGAIRPYVFLALDGATERTSEEQARSEAGRMLGSAVRYRVELAGWRDSQGRLWEPGTTVKLLAPDAFVFSEYELLIRSATFAVSDTARTTQLELTLVEAFSNGSFPERMPWDA